MPTDIVGGYEYLGILELPSISRRLPVAADMSDELLKISPCRYEGSYHTSDFVICGEGYDGHFGSIGTLGIRDTVKFIAVDGTMYEYVVSNIETDKIDEIDLILHDWDLTFFTFRGDDTCLVVRCVRV